MNFKVKHILTAPSILLAAFCWLVVSLIIYYYVSSVLQNEYENRNIEESKNLRSVVKNDVITGNYNRVRGQLETFLEHPDTNLVAIIDKNGEIIEKLHSKEKTLDERNYETSAVIEYAEKNNSKRDTYSSYFVDKNKRVNFVCVAPILFQDLNGDYFGKLILSFNKDSLHTRKFNLLVFLASLIFIALLSQACILNLAARGITKPITGLINSIRLSAKRGWLFPVSVTTKIYEFKELSSEYNTMVDNIKNAQKTIEKTTHLAAIGRSAAMVAHDVRKPLTGMKALLSSLPAIKNDPDQLKKMITNVDRSISQTNTLLNDILEFSRDSTSLNLNETDPQGIIVSALSDAFRNRKNASIKISYDLKHSHVLHVDSNRIVRVLINIMDNAMDAMELNQGEKSAGLLQIGTNEIKRDGKHFIAISVADNGPGLSEEAFARIFDPFFTQGKAGGTGLGLAICHRIISMHGGRIEAANRQDGSGALFTIELPAGEKPVEINEAELIRSSNELKPFREEEALRVDYGDTENTSEFMRINKEKGRLSYLLIVDDEPLFRESVRCLLGELGQVKDHVKVVEADSAEKALTLFRSQEFDYVIADIDLGKKKMNGYEFSRIILDRYHNTHVLIHSNKRKGELDKNIREIENPRFLGFLPKPMRASELLQFLACKTFETSLPQDRKAESRKKVLVLNDDEIQLMSYRLQISSSTVQVFTSTSVSDAMRIYTEQGADLILSDINLGNDEPSGYDFLKCVRERDQDIPFYFVSGYSRQEEEPKAKEQGATGYFQIPVKDDDLRGILS